MNTKIILCVLNPQETSTKVLMMTHKWGIFRRRTPKRKKVTLTELSRGYAICLASNKTSSRPPSGPGSKIKSLPE